MTGPPVALTAHLALLSAIIFGGFPTVPPDVRNFVVATRGGMTRARVDNAAGQLGGLDIFVANVSPLVQAMDEEVPRTTVVPAADCSSSRIAAVIPSTVPMTSITRLRRRHDCVQDDAVTQPDGPHGYTAKVANAVVFLGQPARQLYHWRNRSSTAALPSASSSSALGSAS